MSQRELLQAVSLADITDVPVTPSGLHAVAGWATICCRASHRAPLLLGSGQPLW